MGDWLPHKQGNLWGIKMAQNNIFFFCKNAKIAESLVPANYAWLADYAMLLMHTSHLCDSGFSLCRKMSPCLLSLINFDTFQGLYCFSVKFSGFESIWHDLLTIYGFRKCRECIVVVTDFYLRFQADQESTLIVYGKSWWCWRQACEIMSAFQSCADRCKAGRI